MESSDSRPKEPNISVVTARLFEIILDMPFKDRRTLLKDLEAKHSQDRRKFERMPYFMPVDFATLDRAFNGYIQNISSGGMLIEARESIAEGQQLTLAFMRPKSKAFIKVGGQIVRTATDGFGVEFNASIDDIST
jgi:hypothetical protein